MQKLIKFVVSFSNIKIISWFLYLIRATNYLALKNKTLFLLMICSFLVSSCAPNGTVCTLAAEIDSGLSPSRGMCETVTQSNTNKYFFTVYANNEVWINTNILVSPGDTVDIMTRGSVTTCPPASGSLILNPDNQYYQILNSNSQTSSWYLNKPVFLNSCDIFSLTVQDPCPNPRSTTCSDCSNPYQPNSASCNILNYSSAPSKQTYSFTQNADSEFFSYSGLCTNNTTLNGNLFTLNCGTQTGCWQHQGCGVKINWNGNLVDLSRLNMNKTDGSTVYFNTPTVNQGLGNSVRFILPSSATSGSNPQGGYILNYASTASCKTFDGQGYSGQNIYVYDTNNSLVPKTAILEYGQTGSLQAIVVASDSTPSAGNGSLLPNINSNISSTNASVSCPTSLDSNNNLDNQPSNANNFGRNSVSSSGYVWLKIADNDGSYTENMGSYNVYINHNSNFVNTQEVKGAGTFIFETLQYVISIIRNNTENVFNNMTSQGSYVSLIKAMLILYIAVFSIMFTFGLVDFNQTEFVKTVIKIGVLIQLISPNSYQFFNNYLFSSLYDSFNGLISMATGNVCTEAALGLANPLAFTNRILEFLLFDWRTFIKILALYFTTMFGLFYVFVIIYGVVLVIIAICKTICVYCFGMIYYWFLVMVSPIFLSFVLFEFTYGYFEVWIKSMVRVMMDVFIMVVGVCFISDILVIIINDIINFNVCFKCVVPLNINIGGGRSLNLFCIYGFLPAGYDNQGGATSIPIIYKFINVICFLIIAHVLSKYSQIASSLSQVLFGVGAGASAISAGSSMVEETIKQTTKK